MDDEERRESNTAFIMYCIGLDWIGDLVMISSFFNRNVILLSCECQGEVSGAEQSVECLYADRPLQDK